MCFQSAIKKAFSLIELLIVIGMVVIVTGIILASYQVFTEQEAIKLEGSKLVDVIRLAQKRAIAGDNTCTSGTLVGYRIVVNSDSYNFDRVCSGATTTLKTYKFQKVNCTTAGETIVFSTVYGTTSSVDDQTITLYSTQLSQQLDITVSPQGVVSLSSIH